MPELYFATCQLDRSMRQALFSLAAVLDELQRIVDPPVSTEGRPGSGPDRPLVPEGGSEPIEHRHAVATAALDHLLSGRSTGRPELDGLALVLERDVVDQAECQLLLDAMAGQAEVRRWATWRRLRMRCEAIGGTAARITLGVLAHPEPVRAELATALGAAIELTRLVCNVRSQWRRGRLVVPLDDLERFCLTEQDIGRFARQGAPTGLDGRFATLMALQADRARKLYHGGVKALGSVPDRRCRRAVALYVQMQQRHLRWLVRTGGDLFADPAPSGWWSCLRAVGPAMWLAASVR